MTETKNLTAPSRASARSELQSWAATQSDHTIFAVSINRISRRYGYSASVASRIAELAGIGPREARS